MYTPKTLKEWCDEFDSGSWRPSHYQFFDTCRPDVLKKIWEALIERATILATALEMPVEMIPHALPEEERAPMLSTWAWVSALLRLKNIAPEKIKEEEGIALLTHII